ncbi:MAG: site-specific integrase, partial [Candidatus Diapherotrites archaeon]|nr:site-specific integrase [Candidatus Diapherotrites archaeon]
MNPMHDVHNRAKTLARQERKIQNDQTITQEDKDLLLRIKRAIKLAGNSINRQEKVLRIAYKLRLYAGKPLTTLTREDIEQLVETIEDQNWSEWTKYDTKIILKQVIRFIKNNTWEKGSDYPPEVTWIKPKIRKYKQLPEDELITDEEIDSLIQNAIGSNMTLLRNRALLSVLADSGARPAEVLNLTWKDVKPDEYGATLKVTGKTGPREIRIVFSVPHLTNWKRNCPTPKDQDIEDCFVFCSLSTKSFGKPLAYQAARQALIRSAKNAGVKRKLKLYSFRKKKATTIAYKCGLATAMGQMGWSSPNTVRHYVHKNKKLQDNEVLEKLW